MVFWIFAALLTVIAALCVLLPMWREQPKLVSSIEYDKAVYKARIKEIENDITLGKLSPEAAKTAQLEEGRKLISLSETVQSSHTSKVSPNWPNWIVKLANLYGLILLPVGAVGIYLLLGNPQMPDAGLASRLAVAPEQQTIDELVSRAEAHLTKNPKDVRGWSVLAPVYSRIGRPQDALNAWFNVYRLDPSTPEIKATLAESMVAAANGVVTSEARQLFQEELETNNASAKARFYLAMALDQEGKHKEAVGAWQELINGGTSQSPWMSAAREFLEQSANAANIVLTPSTKGPTSEEIDAASQMNTDDRNAMISGMVDGLAERLETEPDNKQGWQQLIRSYLVLGRGEDAKLAISKASKHFQTDPDFIQKLNAITGNQ